MAILDGVAVLEGGGRQQLDEVGVLLEYLVYVLLAVKHVLLIKNSKRAQFSTIYHIFGPP